MEGGHLSTKKWMLGTLVVILALLVGFSAVYAQTADGDPTSGQPQKQRALDILKYAGPIGWVILVLSFVMVGLVIEHFTSIKDDKLIPPDFVGMLQQAIEEKKYQDAMQFCETSDNYISRVMQVGLSEIRYGYSSMVESMSAIGEEESIKLNQKIGYLSLIGTMAPMLGLLGTVAGMISCFKTIAEAPVTNARDLAGGIYQALVTTVMGLLVGIPALFFHSFFLDRVTNIGLEAGAVCEELIRRFKPVKVSGVDVKRAGPAAAKPAGPGAAPPQPTR